jgi:hypothetical protein
MLQKNGYTICRPSEAINMIDRQANPETGRLLAHAVEHLMFSHPYKKFDVVMGQNFMSNGFEVFDFNRSVCKVRFYKPDGDERTALQLEFKYTYNVHSKAPRDTKRTSNVNKISECVRLIKPVEASDYVPALRNAKSLVEETTKFVGCKRAFESIFSSVGYDKVQNNIALFEDLFNKRDTSAVETLRNKFYTRLKDYEVASEHIKRLARHSAIVVRNHSGDYRVVHRITTREGVPEGQVKANYAMVNYDAKDKIPPNIYGKLCLLEIAEQNDGNDHSVEGVGGVDKDGDRYSVYTIIGEDLEEPAVNEYSGAQSKVESD